MCDSMVVPSEKTRDAYTIFAKVSDRACNEPQYFVHSPRATHEKGSKLRCTLIEIEQAGHTHAVILSKPSWIWGCEIGVNEFGVCIGNEAVFSKEINTSSNALLGMDICRIALERAKTAKEAVDVIGEMMEQYGQGGNAGFTGVFYYDNGYLVSDPHETWYVETAGKHLWAAKKVTGSYSISNYLSISVPDVMHKDTMKTAAKYGYSGQEAFNFANTFIDWDHPVNKSGMIRRCDSYRLVQAPNNDYTIKDMLAALRSHTSNNPWTGGSTSVCMHANYPENSNDVSSQSTNSMIAVCKEGDTLLWGPGMSTNCIAPFQPFWFDAYSDKLVFSYDKQEEGMEAWLRKEQLNRAMIDGRLPEKDYKAELYEMEQSWCAQVEKTGKKDRQALCNHVGEEAEKFISKWLDYAHRASPKPQGNKKFQEYWHQLNKELGQNRTIAY